MEQQVTNFARFYAAFGRMHCPVDRDEVKKMMVRQYTEGRTSSLREIRRAEYEALCRAVEKQAGPLPEAAQRRRRLLRELRSAVLHQMQIYGVDTTDWTKVNRFCLDKRIAGKTFRELSASDLEELLLKMRAIVGKKYKK